MLPLGSLLYLLFCTNRYGWGWKSFIKEANSGSGLKFPQIVRGYVSYILPLIVIYIFLQGYLERFSKPWNILIPVLLLIGIVYIPLQAMWNAKQNKNKEH